MHGLKSNIIMILAGIMVLLALVFLKSELDGALAGAAPSGAAAAR